jgi:hypothetical protein
MVALACAPARCGALRALSSGAAHAGAAAAPAAARPHPNSAGGARRSARCAAGRRGASPAVLEAVQARARDASRMQRRSANACRTLQQRRHAKTKATAATLSLHARARVQRPHAFWTAAGRRLAQAVCVACVRALTARARRGCGARRRQRLRLRVRSR